MDLLEEALEWAAAGVPVFPCNSRKRPMVENGHLDASTDPAVVEAMFSKHRHREDVLIGARMGRDSGLFCVDLDLYKLNGSSAWYERMLADGLLPETRQHRTMQGGIHLIYRSETAWPNMKPAQAIEVKGEGGYIIVPPSRGYSVEKDIPCTIAPQGLIDELHRKKSETSATTITGLKQKILEASDFHDALAMLAAKMAGMQKDSVDIMKVMMETMRASVASSPQHERHARWASLMSDDGRELSRIAGTAYNKYHPNSATEQAEAVITPEMFADLQKASGRFGFASPPRGDEEPDKLPPVPEVTPDDWDDPIFTNEGYFVHENLDVLDQRAVIYPILHEMESAIISAAPKSGKTLVAMTLCMNAACGFNISPALQVPAQVGVVYYGLEGQSAIKKRAAAWKQYQKEKGVELPERIPMYIGTKSKNLLKEEVRERETAWLMMVNSFFMKKLGIPLGLVVVDTFTKAMPGGDQNSAEVTSMVFDIIGKIRDAGLTCSILFIHHKGKAGEGPRGSSNIAAEADVLMSVEKKDFDIALTVDQARSIEEGGSYLFTVKNAFLGTGEQGHEVRAPVLEAVDAVISPAGGEMAAAMSNKKALDALALMPAGSHTLLVVLQHLENNGVTIEVKRSRRNRNKLTGKEDEVQDFFEKLIPDTGYTYRDKLIQRRRDGNGDIDRILVSTVAV